MTDFLARLTKEQEDRENKEARERFAESQRKRWGRQLNRVIWSRSHCCDGADATSDLCHRGSYRTIRLPRQRLQAMSAAH